MSLLYRALAVAALLAALVGLGAYALHQRDRALKAEEGLKSAHQEAQRTQATLTYREGLRSRQDGLQALQRVRLDAVLATNTDWGDTPVPEEVQVELCSIVRCAVPPASGGLRDGAASSPSP